MKKNVVSISSCYIFLVLSSISLYTYAGFHNFTMHSRANCGGFNESVSWHALHNNMLYTISQHVSTKKENWWKCDLHTGWADTWRSAAFHYAEGYEGGEWASVGYHWGKAVDKKSDILLSTTLASDCNIYDGWWDV